MKNFSTLPVLALGALLVCGNAYADETGRRQRPTANLFSVVIAVFAIRWTPIASARNWAAFMGANPVLWRISIIPAPFKREPLHGMPQRLTGG